MAGSAAALSAVPVDAGVNFAAHVEHRGLVVDRTPDHTTAVVVPGGSSLFSSGPRFLIQSNGKTIAALWFPKRSQMIVRQTADPHSPLIGEVDAAWKDGAISLTLKPTHGFAFHTSTFDRVDGRLAPAALSSQAQTVLDLRGVYRAELRDAEGAPVGWLRAQISPHQAARRIYDGVVPAALNGPLLTAATAVLNADVRYIRNHALDVYQGN